MSLVKILVWRWTRSSVWARTARSWVAASRPSGEVPRTPASTCSSRPDTRTSKNSSRFWLKIATNLARSSSGRAWSSARARTRALNSSHDSSRFRNREPSVGGTWAGAAEVIPGAYRPGGRAVPGLRGETTRATASLDPRMSSDPRFLPPTPFTRLVRLQAASVIGDAALAGSLVGSLFFSGTTSGARDKVLLALVLTLLPFAIVTPLLGPALDRAQGGRRLIAVLCCVGRCILCLVMSRYVTKPSPEGLLIYPLAFGALVFGKGYAISRSALVPALVGDSSELVKANSRLALISNVFTPIGALPALALQKVFDADVSLVFAAIVFAVATGLSLKLPKTEAKLDRRSQRLAREELHQPSILLAGSAMGIL